MARRKRSDETREAFISAALDLCREGGPQAVSARRLGRILGLSQMAVYRHFQDMEDLLGHAWDRAFAELLDTIYAEVKGEDPKRDFRNGLLAYVRWGMANPGLYRLMFFVHFERFEVLQEQVTALRGLQLLHDVIEKCLHGQGLSVDPEELRYMTLQSWFTVHGLTTVAISGPGRFQRAAHEQPDEVATNIIDRLCESLSMFRQGVAGGTSDLSP